LLNHSESSILIPPEAKPVLFVGKLYLSLHQKILFSLHQNNFNMRVFRMRLFFFLPFLALLNMHPVAQTTSAQGNLFIIGGGDRTDELVKKLIQTAGLHSGDHIAILPMSSAEPDSSYFYIKSDIEKACKNTIAYLNFTAATEHDPAMLDSVKNARLIFITGGDQSRFMKIVGKGPIYQAIHAAFNRGATVAGTSAGAAVMSKQMITGNQLSDTVYHETIGKLLAKNIEIKEGLGLVEHVIIDQHFVVRSRYNRLISALHDYPGFLGIGIDESTAIIIHHKQVNVVGESQVLLFSAPQPIQTTKADQLKAKKIELTIFTAGDKFQLK